ncbi:MAG: sugar phosphate isomerase/epimerase [Candidatus Anammoximicrobium sp.]|nr:sugar phosphate isomerase/epimerase [Candidatus Anammoximicrobium sp.]
MMAQVTRRKFLACSAAAGAAAGWARFGGQPVQAAEPLVRGTPAADKLGWRVGFSAYTFRGLTLFEALDKIAAVGLRYTELFAWQKLSPQHADAKPGPALSKTLRQDLKKKASDLGIQMIACYTGLDSPDAAKAFFEFAADMGFQALVSEPPEGVLDAIEKLTEEYKIDLALHNHPKPSHYWNPETGLKALEGRSPRMGFCCDTGHWCRCGLEPVPVLKQLGARVKTFHLKDLDDFGVPGARDVIWGQGKGRIAEILAEVKRQGLKPYFGIEWERTADSEPALHAEAVAFLEKTAQKLVAGS